MEKKIIARRVDIMQIMQVLKEMYDKGVDYVDVSGILNGVQDTISFTVYKQYMNEEYADNFEVLGDDPLPSKVDVKLSDEDINNLI